MIIQLRVIIMLLRIIIRDFSLTRELERFSSRYKCKIIESKLCQLIIHYKCFRYVMSNL